LSSFREVICVQELSVGLEHALQMQRRIFWVVSKALLGNVCLDRDIATANPIGRTLLAQSYARHYVWLAFYRHPVQWMTGSSDESELRTP